MAFGISATVMTDMFAKRTLDSRKIKISKRLDTAVHTMLDKLGLGTDPWVMRDPSIYSGQSAIDSSRPLHSEPRLSSTQTAG